MVGQVLGESWHIYRKRFGIIVFFSFFFFALGYTLYYGGILAISRGVSGVSMDFIGVAVRFAQGTPFEELFFSYPGAMDPGGAGLAAMPLMMFGIMGAALLVFAYGILAVPMGMAGLTVVSSGAGGPLSWRRVFQGVRQRYGKLLTTFLCYMVYTMAAGFAFMIVYMIVGVLIAIAVALITISSGAGVAFGIVLITLSALIILAAYTVVMILPVFIMPAAVFDREYHFRAVGRSLGMAWRHFFPVLGVQLVTALLIGLSGLLLFGVFFAVAWAAPDIPVYTPLWYGCVLSLGWPFSVIVNGVLYRHIQEREETTAPKA